jgi:hypothetical protein
MPGKPAEVVRFAVARVAAAAAAILIVIVVAGFFLAHQASGPVAGWATSAGHDGLWLGPGWVTGFPSSSDTAAERAQLTRRIRASGVADVYVPVGAYVVPGMESGAASGGARLTPTAATRSFLSWFRRTFPHVQVCAWLSGSVGRDQLDLDDTATQRDLVASARTLLQAGFTGISYDLAPVASGDAGLLAVLDQTRALHPAVLSVDTPKLEPLTGMALPAALIMRHPVFWTSAYLKEVASRVTQVAVLGFDTGVPLSSWYSGYVKRETSVALQAVPAKVGLVIAAPANGGSNESVAATIHGARVALTATGRRHALFGVGLYTEGSATASDWSAYQADWVRR